MDAEQELSTSGGKTFGERWHDMYERLVRFKEKNGHCLVPNRYTGDKKLGAWVSAQRRHYKILTSGKKESTPMTLERAQKLIDIGFDWSTSDPRHVSWEDRFDQLKNFKKKYGHVQVPMGWDENPSLSNWVSAQRQDYKLFQKGRPSRLDQHKVNMLNMLGFIWEAQRGGRRRKLEPLKEEEQEAVKSPPLPPAVQAGATGLSTQATAPLNQAAAAVGTGASQAASLPQLHNLPSRLAGNTGTGMNSGMLASGLDHNMSPTDMFRSRLAAGVNNSSLLGSGQLLTPLQQQRLQLLAQLQSTATAPQVSDFSMLGRAGADTLMGHPALNASAELALRLRQQRAQQEQAFLRDQASLASLAAREGIGPPPDLQGASAYGPGPEEQVHLFSDSLRDLESMRCQQNPSSTSQPGPVNAHTAHELLMVRNILGVGQNLPSSDPPPFAAAAAPGSERVSMLRTALAATNKRSSTDCPPSRADMLELAFGGVPAPPPGISPKRGGPSSPHLSPSQERKRDARGMLIMNREFVDAPEASSKRAKPDA